jgi:hypothetical protein
VVRLYKNGTTSQAGIFHCEIPDSSGENQNIYVGIYHHSKGILQCS